MRIYIDESGDFQSPANASIHKAAIVTGLVVPETRQEHLFASYQAFAQSLTSAEKNNGEPKGKLLTKDSRTRFCKLLPSDVIVVPTTLDLSVVSSRKQSPQEELVEYLRNEKISSIYKADKGSLLASQAQNLDQSELLKLFMYATSALECVRNALRFLVGPSFDGCWDNIEIVIDEFKTGANTREKSVFQVMLPTWVKWWCGNNPISVEHIDRLSHPFLRRFSRNGAYSVTDLFGDIRWAKSSSEPGIQLADICSSLIYSAVHDLQNRSGTLEHFVSVMGHCPLYNGNGPGLIYMPDSSLVFSKYEPLIKALKRRYRNEPEPDPNSKLYKRM